MCMLSVVFMVPRSTLPRLRTGSMCGGQQKLRNDHPHLALPCCAWQLDFDSSPDTSVGS